MKTFLVACILILVGVMTFIANRMIVIENERYALFLGMCHLDHSKPSEFFHCLETTNTRTTSLWHLYYALTNTRSIPKGEP